MTGTSQSQTETLEQIAACYLQAWNTHDLDAICAMHTDEPVVQLAGAGGTQTIHGSQAIREAYAYLLRAWPDQRLEAGKVLVAGDVVVIDSTLTATLAPPWQMGAESLAPSDPPVRFAIHDVLEFDGGRIAGKSTWIDGIAIRGQLARGVTSQAPGGS